MALEYDTKGSTSGLTEEEAKAFHSIFVMSFLIFTGVAVVAHFLVWQWRPWIHHWDARSRASPHVTSGLGGSNVESMVALRSAESFGCPVYLPVRSGVADSFHFAQHRSVQLVGRAACPRRNRLPAGAASGSSAGQISPAFKTTAFASRQCARPALPLPAGNSRETSHGNAQFRAKI